ncbi:MAG TPA: hypothetical protein PLZ57_03000 [Pseudobdellovibrionaceae bacterium]|nr:hypothetical protein [Pseudobdellovibrionaceae bacterium]
MPLRRLRERIEYHLFNALVEGDRPESVVDAVVAETLAEQLAAIPLPLRSDYSAELREHTLEIVRKLTYGALTIGDFKTRRPRNPSRDEQP